MANRMMIASYVIANVALSILIVLLNKWIYTHYGFPNITMTCLHFVSTTICVSICHSLEVFYRKSLPLWDMFPLSLTFCGFVVFTNLSLEANTIGTYQLFKMLTSPLIVLIQSYRYHRQFSNKIKLTLVPIMVGVFLNSYADLRFSTIGTIFGIIGALITSAYQVLVGAKHLELQANSLQMLYYQAPFAATLLMFIIPAVEPIFSDQGFFAVWSYEALAVVVLSSIVAFGVNLSIFWIIGNLSPLSYNVIGHMKFCITLLGGLVVFNEHLGMVQFIGICLAFSGSLAYSAIVRSEDKMENHRRMRRTV